MICEQWNEVLAPKAMAFLEERYASSLFLLNNLVNHGPRLGDAPNSGNFRVLLEGDAVRAVYSLTKRGNLLVSGQASYELLESCRHDGVPVKGVIGDWDSAQPVWAMLASPTCSFSSREILYRLDSIPHLEQTTARLLTPADFPAWKNIPPAYHEETGLAYELTEDQLRESFERYANAGEHWGLFEGERIVAVAALNAKAMGIAQVGGVYTVPDRRGRGLSKLVMRQLLRDCALVHGLKRVLLFTGEENVAAQRVYESLGFERIGWFGIFFA